MSAVHAEYIASLRRRLVTCHIFSALSQALVYCIIAAWHYLFGTSLTLHSNACVKQRNKMLTEQSATWAAQSTSVMLSPAPS